MLSGEEFTPTNPELLSIVSYANTQVTITSETLKIYNWLGKQDQNLFWKLLHFIFFQNYRSSPSLNVSLKNNFKKVIMLNRGLFMLMYGEAF
jgi:hypothetical protein